MAPHSRNSSSAHDAKQGAETNAKNNPSKAANDGQQAAKLSISRFSTESTIFGSTRVSRSANNVRNIQTVREPLSAVKMDHIKSLFEALSPDQQAILLGELARQKKF
ncbi:hypothetical protein C8034_v007454 [Colletotrichum sidae]|uniref:Uncharacterized protein n=1 Tax=Colletotrichum sidae TaxID=1347389 RepID=A0A4R8T3H6_9PEZI|nr:hypothetical protein C8034_v007454 [Colletotrichum sidae]